MSKPHLQELRITVNPGHAAELIAAIDSQLCNGWTRARDEEEKAAPALRERLACYHCDEREGRPASFFSLYLWGDAFWQGSRTTPDRKGEKWELTDAEHNAVVQDFHNAVLNRLPTDSCLGFAIGPLTELPPMEPKWPRR